MTDHAEPMDPFEMRLTGLLREASAPAVQAVDARAIAAGVVAERRSRRRWRVTGRIDLSPSHAWAAALLVLLVALLIVVPLAMLAAGSRPPGLGSHLGHLAYEQDGEIYVADADGSNPVRVSDAAPGRAATEPRWLGTTLSYVEFDSDSSGPVDFVMLDGAGAEPRRIRTPWDGGRVPTGTILLAPDGSHYAYLAPGRLQVIDTDGNAVSIDPPPGFRIWDTSDLASLDWAPDGRALLVGACEDEPCQKASDAIYGPIDGEHDLFEVSADGRSVRQLSDGVPPAWGARYSPDGARIAFTSCRVAGQRPAPNGCDAQGYSVGVMDRDGSGRRIVDATRPPDGFGSGFSFRWSPDGSAIAYTFDRGRAIDATGSTCGLYVADIDDSVPPHLIGPCYPPLAWSPDGSELLVAGYAQGTELATVSVDGSGLRPMPGTGHDGDWEWVPDGAADPFATPAP